MKHLFSIVIAILISTIALSQTTLEEYNYLSKGYKIQIESGLDMKKGYNIEDVGDWSIFFDSRKFSRNASFKFLYKEGIDKPVATLMIQKRSDTDHVVYYCIPHIDSSEEIWDLAYKDFRKMTEKWEGH